MGGRGNLGNRAVSGNRLQSMSNEQLDKLYESAAASKDRELMKEILTEWRKRDDVGKPEEKIDLGTIKKAKKRGNFKKRR